MNCLASFLPVEIMHADAPVQLLLIAASSAQTTGKPSSSDCQSQSALKSSGIILTLMACVVLIVFAVIVVSRYYVKKSLMTKAQKQVHLFDQLMERTRQKKIMVRNLRKRQRNDEKFKAAKSAASIPEESITVVSGQLPTTRVRDVGIRQPMDEYGRNIARIQTHRSLLYENAIEIKEENSEEESDEQNECFDTNQ